MSLRRAAVAVTTGLVATTAVLAAHPTSKAAEIEPGCTDGVTVVVDGNQLGGDPDVTCVHRAGTASELFTEAGFTLEYQPQLQDFVCRVAGRPAEGPCTDGDSYWSLWWAKPGGSWVYSTLGVTSLEVPTGGSLAFAWHQAEGDAAPPDVAVAQTTRGASNGTSPGESATADGPPPNSSDGSKGDGGTLPTWIGLGLAALVLGAAGLVAALRRRSG
jgi:hypothetical protein